MGFKRICELRLRFAPAVIFPISLGLFLMLTPNTSRTLLCILVAAGALLYGLSNIISHLPGRHEQRFTLAFLSGIFMLAFGVFSLIHPTFLLDFLFTVLALVVLISGTNGIRHALKLRSMGYMRWWGPLWASLATALIALSMMIFPGFYGNLLMMLCGILLTTSGICELWSRYYLDRYLHP